MKSLSVIEISKLYGMTRQAVYKQINKGNLSKKSDGKIDFSEAIRVFGEPSQRVTSSQTTETRKLSEVHLLEQQIHILQKQLEQAQEREQFHRNELQAKNDQLNVKDEQIQAMHRLLEAPRTSTSPIVDSQHLEAETTSQRSKIESNYDGLTTSFTTNYENTPVLKSSTEEPKKRGLLGRLTKAFFED